MKVVRHPTLDTTREVSESAEADWLAAGWLPLLDADQEARLAEIAAEVELRCPTCDASGEEPCVTAQGMPTAPHVGRTSF